MSKTTKPEPMVCATCSYWSHSAPDDVSVGDCRRHPPAVINGGSNWPETISSWWCGEWRKFHGQPYGPLEAAE